MRLAELFPRANIPEALAGREIKGISADSRAVTRTWFFSRCREQKRTASSSRRKRFRAALSQSSPSALPQFPSRPLPSSRRRTSGAPWRTRRRACTRASPKRSLRSPERAARPRSPISCVRFGPRSAPRPLRLARSASSRLRGRSRARLTTPDPVTLHKTLDGLARGGVTHLALEASSHGILQRRLDGVRLSAGAFTNLSRDHLDYHATLEDYLAAKLQLFERLLAPGQPAVVDADSDVAAKVVAVCEKRGLRVVSTGFKGTALRLLESGSREFFDADQNCPWREDFLAPSSACRFVSGVERACRRRSLHCHGKLP